MQRKIITLMFGTLQKVIQVNTFLYILIFFYLSLYLHNPLLLLYFTKVSLRNLKQHQEKSAVSKFDLGLSLLLTIVTGQLHDDGELKQAKWASVVNHVANKHENHSRKYPRCEHAPINDERQWIKEGNVFKINCVNSNNLYLLHSRYNIIFVNFRFNPLQADERYHFEPFPYKGHFQTFTCSPNLQP